MPSWLSAGLTSGELRSRTTTLTSPTSRLSFYSPGSIVIGEDQSSGGTGNQTPVGTGTIFSARSNLAWDTLTDVSPSVWLDGANFVGAPNDAFQHLNFNWNYASNPTPFAGYNSNAGCAYFVNFSTTCGTTTANGLNDHTGNTAAYNPTFLDRFRGFYLASSKLYGVAPTAGTWTSGTNYTVGQIVQLVDPTYYNSTPVNFVCIQNNTASANNEPGIGTITTSAPSQVTWRLYWQAETINSTWRLSMRRGSLPGPLVIHRRK